MTAELERSHVEEARREKRDRLEALGVSPYAYRYPRSQTAAEALALWDDAMGEEGPEVRVAGRLAGIRTAGKTVFAHLEDVSGRIQVYFRRQDLEPGGLWSLVDLLDLDDHVGVAGRLFRTRTGEVTVRAVPLAGDGRTPGLVLLSKSLRPLPRGKVVVQPDGTRKAWSGLTDPEIRYRQRYADLAVHPEVRDVFRLRAAVIRYCREFLDARGFLEVETPILQTLYGGASARPFVTHHNALDLPLYLRIADELYLKRLVVGGLERVYEIGHDFRNEGMDRSHNPEFTMLEFYQAYADYGDMMTLVEELVTGLVQQVTGGTRIERGGVALDFTPPWRRVRFVEGIRERAGVDVREAGAAELRAVLGRHGVPRETAAEFHGAKLVDEVFKAVLEPHLVQPTFLMDYPVALSPLAKLHRDDSSLTERFELFVQGHELANAFSELNDPDDQRRRFEDQAALRAEGDDEAQPFDADYVRALEYGMPPTGGCGIGIDRLVMLLADQPSIRDVILFPAMRPES